MAVNTHLQWMEVNDFSAGLWTVGDTWAMPANAAQQMQDCYALPSGGLRAFYRRQAFGTLGANLLTANQASIETSAAGWTGSGGTTSISRSTSQAADGQASLAITNTGGAATIFAETGTGTSGVAVQPSTQYTALISGRSNTTVRAADVTIRWYTSAGAFISASTGSGATLSNAAFTQLTVTATSPANAAFAAVRFEVLATGGSEIHFFDKASLALGAATTWDAPTAGLDPANEVYFGIFAAPSGGINPSSDRYLMAWNTTTDIPKLYYSTGAQWNVIKFFTATSSTPTLKQSFFTTYLSGTTRKVVFNLNVGSANDGIWIGTGGGAPTAMTVTGGTAPGGPICVHQARIVVSDGSSIRWTDPGTETFQSANFINVEPSGIRPNTVMMVSYEPSDLLIGKEAGPFVLVQGDLSSALLRAMDETVSLVAQQRPAKTPMGLAITAHRDGVYMTQAGTGTAIASKDLTTNNFALPAVFGTYTPSWIGDCFYAEGFLFTPGALMALASGSWFTAINGPGNYLAAMYCYDRGT